ncbi:granzyme B(G,H)-like [Garra rufa]|uniref:granzyme B(G,H)-like n=1 Tax=Garra rufa TaxID=137080 RepID=UPI003CCE9E07
MANPSHFEDLTQSYIMVLSICLLLSIFSLSGGFESGIVGGHEVKPHSKPYMASLQYRRQHICGGMLIRNDYVLTSAHCLNNTDTLEVVLGAHNISQNEDSQQIIQVEKYIKHPKYENEPLSYDIMLLKLKTKAVRNEFVSVIKLPKNNENISAHVQCSIAGWGMTKPGGRVSNILREVSLKLELTFKCKNKWKYHFKTEKMICSVSDGKRAFCQGDSGSPLLCDSELKGMAAYTYHNDCTFKEYPQVYIKISAFLPWIKKTLSD